MQRQTVTTDDPLRWLSELREHLVPAVEIINGRGEAILPAVRGDTATRLRRLVIAPIGPAIEALLRDATAAHALVFAHIEGLRVAAVGVRDEAGEPLTLVLAERADAGRDAARRAELARVATWLGRALTRSRVSATGDPVRDWHELSVLHRMLNKAIAKGSVAAVMHAFVEALAIWADTDTRAYVGDRAGRFVLETSLAGADANAAPRLIPAAQMVGVTSPTRLDTRDAERLGFSPDVDVIVAPVQHERTSWLLAYQGHFSPFDRDRLELFHDMLLPALHAASEVEASRLMWSMMQRLVGEPRSPREAVSEAMGELEQAGLCTAAMLVLRRGGEVLMELGVPVPADANGEPWPAPAIQNYRLAVPDPFAASLTLWRPTDRPFTGPEARLGEIGASVLGSWTAGALRRGDILREAASVRPSDRRAKRAGSDVSLLVIRPEATRTTTELRELWVGEIRRRLRPADVTGALSSGEIGVLLPGTASDDAYAVASRLKRVFGQQTALALLERAPIGIATGRSRSSDGYTLLRQARAHADGAQEPGAAVS